MANRKSFANVPNLGPAAVILAFETFVLAPTEDNDEWLECFKLTWLNRNGFEQSYTWVEERTFK